MMTQTVRLTNKSASAALLAALMLAGAQTKIAELSFTTEELPLIEIEAQTNQALELLSKVQKGLALSAESHEDLRPFIMNIVRRGLPERFQDRAYEIARAVITEANRNNMDPFFLLAVIQTESQFNVHAIGGHGEIGLMQILPSTAKWLAPQMGLNPEQIDLKNPAMNIRVGAHYFAMLRKDFKGIGHHYVAAYNMGSGNVRRLLASNIPPRIYPDKVLGNYERFYTGLDSMASENLSRSLASVD